MRLAVTALPREEASVSVQSSWGILRQVVIATTDHDGDVAAVQGAFGLGPRSRIPS